MNSNRQYTYCKNDSDQYKGIDFGKTKIVNAQYVDTYAHTGNPYIEALPLPTPSMKEMVASYTCAPKDFPSAEKLNSLDPVRRKMVLDKIKGIHLVLPFCKDIEEEFHRALCDSYCGREEVEFDQSVEVEGVQYDLHTCLNNPREGEATAGFSIIGYSGTGKTTEIQRVLAHFPQVIKHDFNGDKAIQIVYLLVTCPPNSNFTELYKNIGMAVDKALKRTDNFYEEMIEKRKSLGAKLSKVKEIVNELNVGMIIIDEIQLIDTSKTKENSIQAFLTLNNETKTAISVIGTEDSFTKLFKEPRTVRRLSPIIFSEDYCSDEKVFRSILRGLFLSYPIFESMPLPTKEIIDVFWEKTGGIIKNVVYLFMYAAEDYYAKNCRPEITPEYIFDIAEKKMLPVQIEIDGPRGMYSMITLRQKRKKQFMEKFGGYVKPERSSDEYSESMADNETSNKIPDNLSNIDVAPIVESIRSSFPDYTSDKIKNAVSIALTKNCRNEFDVMAAAISHLKSHKSDKRTKEKKLSPPSMSTEQLMAEIEKRSK